MDLVARVEQEIIKERLLERGDCIVAAVSGGPDSVAMLHVLFALSERWGWRLVVAHLDHGFRGAESKAEADFVLKLAAGLGLPCVTEWADTPRYIRETGKNPQVAARELRYRFLHGAASLHGANRIALAHHAGDQAETVLMRLLRGTGPAGLSGIPMRRMEKELELVRPLLRISKLEVLEYCDARHLQYVVDSSNLESKYARNRIRLELMPLLQREYNEQLPEALNRLSEMMTAENAFLDEQTGAMFEQFVDKENDRANWSRKWFCGVHVALQRRLIKLILNYLAFGAESTDFLKLEQIRDAVLREEPSNLSLDIGANLKLTREYDRISLHIYVVPPISFSYPVLLHQQLLEIPETGDSLTCMWLDRNAFDKAEELSSHTLHSAWFDAEELTFPLRLRSRNPGDRMDVYGLNGSKKVKDIFIDAKIPPRLRNFIPVMADREDRVIWLPGIRRSSHALVTDRTRFVVYMTLHRRE